MLESEGEGRAEGLASRWPHCGAGPPAGDDVNGDGGGVLSPAEVALPKPRSEWSLCMGGSNSVIGLPPKIK